VYIDRTSGRPLPLEDDFFAIYGDAVRQRRVSGRLRHDAPPVGASSRPWALRDSDFDLLDHVNNARSWEAVDDELVARLPGREVRTADMEFRGALGRGDAVDLLSAVDEHDSHETQLAVWLVSGGQVRVSALVTTTVPG
jgi:acyl-ACP thioesterase